MGDFNVEKACEQEPFHSSSSYDQYLLWTVVDVRIDACKKSKMFTPLLKRPHIRLFFVTLYVMYFRTLRRDFSSFHLFVVNF